MRYTQTVKDVYNKWAMVKTASVTEEEIVERNGNVYPQKGSLGTGYKSSNI